MIESHSPLPVLQTNRRSRRVPALNLRMG